MFQMYPGALDTEVQRRREVALATMRAANGRSVVARRVADVNRVRHVVITMAMALAAAA
ncbi:MAG TPA: hypothetical protein VGM28_06965 [Candidatus Limnocylindrales bacterium]|jgi:hypothetical protein